jgi:hypothetical protein
MATTTNYGWTTPDDTALVKDGAAAIRTLGSSVDTTTKALNPSTTLGDIEYRSSTANTNTRLGIGTTGQVLTVAGGVPSWATAAAPASSLTKIASSTFTTQSSVAVDGCFTSTYTKYLLIYSVIGSVSPSSSLYLQYRYAGPTTQTSSYLGAGIQYDRGNVRSDHGFDNVSQAVILPYINSQTSAGQLLISNVGNASETPIHSGHAVQGYGQAIAIMSCLLNTARTYTGFLLSPSSGTITGTYAVYGYEN